MSRSETQPTSTNWANSRLLRIPIEHLAITNPMIIKKTLKPLVSFAILQLSVALPATATSNILYLNSIRGFGTANLGPFRSTIADFIDNYEDGNVFDVDFVQTHVSGDLASFLNAKPIDYYDQIWFDTTIYRSSLLNAADFDALNTWSVNKQP
ncbi:MAG: hypothetical protein QNJ74_16445 [Trichodesmium sp. MO_231.B1]|nr:hypothetical protein [Trichodesmium sp. MO_231.B1]